MTPLFGGREQSRSPRPGQHAALPAGAVERGLLEDPLDLARRVTWLMLGRLAVVTLLLGGTLVLTFDEERGFASFTPRFVLSLILGTYLATLGSAVWLPRARRVLHVAYAQTTWDLLLTTALVYVGGGAGSGFTFLYGTTVLMAAIVIGQRAAQAATLGSLVLYLFVGIALSNGWLPFPNDQPSTRYVLKPADATFTMLVNIFGLLLVAFLATSLAARLHVAGGQLRQAAAQAADLSRLNADIIRSLSSGLMTTDEAGAIRTLNPAALEIFRTGPDDMIGKPIAHFFRDAHSADAAPQRVETLAGRPDGSHFPVGFSKTPLIDTASTVTGALFLFQDLTELTELRRAAVRAERLASLGRLAAALAHEIRNPLGSISGSVQLVREAPALDPEDRHLLGIVLGEVDRLNGLVSTMLQVGRPRDPEPATTDLVALTRDVVAVATRDERHREARVEITHPPRQLTAWIDGDQMRQVIWNLLNNALTHAPPKSRVLIEIAQQDDSTLWTIEDEGPGVPAEARDHLFDMFYSKRPHGVGLGLALVDQIVRAHGGSVTVVSPEGQGAKFCVRVPSARPGRAS